MTVKLAAKARDEKNNASEIKNILGVSVLVKINLLNFLNCFNILLSLFNQLSVFNVDSHTSNIVP